ncbi:MAG TPA: porin family protein [Prolixibacteraceae bacterium]|nr:porin family protein [Prolixibacteraceae bacterium]
MFACVAGNTISAQTGVRFGLKAGYSMALQYGIEPANNTYVVETQGRNGFAGGAFVYFPITEPVGIQQEFLYAMKGSGQDVTMTTPANINTVSEYELNYFEMPIVIKYKFVKIKNVGIYGTTGIALSLLLDGEYRITNTINMGGPPVVMKESGDEKGLDTFDYSFVYGAGADFKLLKKDFFLEYRMTIGWNTLQMPNATGAAPVPLRNQDYIFAVGMYF